MNKSRIRFNEYHILESNYRTDIDYSSYGIDELAELVNRARELGFRLVSIDLKDKNVYYTYYKKGISIEMFIYMDKINIEYNIHLKRD